MNAAGFSLIALLPALLGPLPQEGKTITALLCSGDRVIEIDIPIADDEPAQDGPCHNQGCHAGSCRKQIDRDQ